MPLEGLGLDPEKRITAVSRRVWGPSASARCAMASTTFAGFTPAICASSSSSDRVALRPAPHETRSICPSGCSNPAAKSSSDRGFFNDSNALRLQDCRCFDHFGVDALAQSQNASESSGATLRFHTASASSRAGPRPSTSEAEIANETGDAPAPEADNQAALLLLLRTRSPA